MTSGSHRATALLVLLLLALSLPDLLAPPTSSTIWRQTQTAMETRNFLAAGWDVRGLTVDVNGPEPLPMLFEFPLLNALAGLVTWAGVPLDRAGKLVSWLASVGVLILLVQVAGRESPATGLLAGLFWLVMPLALLMRTAFQPDALALLLTLGGAWQLDVWRRRGGAARVGLAGLLLAAAALTKFPVVVPFAPLLAWLLLRGPAGWRIPWTAGLALGLVVLLPLAAWVQVTKAWSAPELQGELQAMFLIGDLRRFLSARFLLKPAVTLGVYLLGLGGVIFLLAGLRRLPGMGWALLAGLPFYLVVIPTAGAQHYYLYPVSPILAWVMARGARGLWQGGRAGARWGAAGAAALYVLTAAVFAPYLLRRDRVMEQAAALVAAHSAPEDLVVSLALHDRVYVRARWYTELHHLSGRRGWNVPYDPAWTRDELRDRVAERARAGARWLILTRYAPAQEPWFAAAVPEFLRRDPRVDTAVVQAVLDARYPAAARSGTITLYDLHKAPPAAPVAPAAEAR